MNSSLESRKAGRHRSGLFGWLAAIATFVAAPAHAYTYAIVHHFNDGSIVNDGKSPYQPPIMAPDGNFYGVTVAGGSAGYGTVFRMTPSGAVTDLHSFGSQLYPWYGEMVPDGCYPANAPLVSASDGNIYGTTRSTCGELFGGRFYRVDVATGVYTMLNAEFGTRRSAPSEPQGIVQNSAGFFIGVSATGSSIGNLNTNTGTTFRITPDGREMFEWWLPGLSMTNGPQWPIGAISLGSVDGYMYAASGGSTGLGDLFKTPQNSPWLVTVLHRFSDGSVANDGWGPAGAPIQLSDSSLVGTAAFGGQYNGGVIYQISASGAYSIVHQFGSVANDGNLPFCVLYKAPDGTIYGTTWIGGASGGGVLFKLTP